MHLPDHVLGYREFTPERTETIFLSTERRLTGNLDTLHRDEADVTWVRVSHAISYLTFKGKIVRRGEGCYDFYHFMSSVADLFESAPKRAAGWQIEQDSELEHHVVAYLEDLPTLGFAKTDYGRRYYKPVGQHVWHDVPDLVEVGGPFTFENFPYEKRRRIEPIKHGASVVWKSSRTAEENETALAGFKALANAEGRETYANEVEIADD
jgi:hypothetical protein